MRCCKRLANLIYRSCFYELNDRDQCRAFEYLAILPCAANDSLSVKRDNDACIRNSECFLCDGTPPPKSTTIFDAERCQSVCGDAVKTFIKVIKSSTFAEARRPRVLAMIALKRYTMHFNNAEFMDLSSSPLGQWCVASLKSSSRELRIAAG